jgi:aminoglycoside phosphotransferase (APT) family kinase protein
MFVGDPSVDYPWHWLIAPLLPGEPASTARHIDYAVCARQLGEFFVALHHPAPDDAPMNPFRGGPLSDRDTNTRERLEELKEMVDFDRLIDLWGSAVEAPEHPARSVWLHGDPHPGNLLVSAGRLSGVIDFGDITAGDPATDLALVWSFLPPTHRDAFWESYGDSDPYLRERARGWALSLGAVLLARSADNPTMRAIGERTLGAVLDET